MPPPLAYALSSTPPKPVGTHNTLEARTTRPTPASNSRTVIYAGTLLLHWAFSIYFGRSIRRQTLPHFLTRARAPQQQAVRFAWTLRRIGRTCASSLRGASRDSEEYSWACRAMGQIWKWLGREAERSVIGFAIERWKRTRRWPSRKFVCHFTLHARKADESHSSLARSRLAQRV